MLNFRCERGFHTGDPEAGAIFFHHLQALVITVLGEDGSLISHELRDEGGLAARRGAEVENGFSGFGAEPADGEQGAGVLHVEEPGLEAGQLIQGRMRFQPEDVVGFGPVPIGG